MSRRKKKTKTSLCTILLFSGLLLSAAEIGEVRFEQRCRLENRIPEAPLLYSIKAREGQEYDPQAVSEDLRRLNQSELAADAEVTAKDMPDGRISLTFIVRPRPIIENVRIEGNKKFDTKELMNCTKRVLPSTPWNEATTTEAWTELRNYYSNNGYNEAIVTLHILPDEKDSERVNVIFRIEEGLRVKVNDVTFEGNTVFYGFTLRALLANRHSYLSWILDYGLFQQNQMDADVIRLREQYWEKGYLDFRVDSQIVTEAVNDPEYIDIHFVLFEGARYKVDTVSVTGTTQFLPADLERDLGLQRGDWFNHKIESADINRIQRAYHRLGFDDVRVEAIRYADPDSSLVAVEYRITEGIRTFVRIVNNYGNVYTHDDVILREVDLTPGDPYDRNKIDHTRSRLMATGFLDDVEIYTTGTENPELKDVNIKVKESQFWEFRIGGGISDIDSLAGMILLRHKNFNIAGIPGEDDDLADPNSWFTGAGQTLSIAAMVGVEMFNFDLHFSEPWLFNRPYRLDVHGYVHTRFYDEWKEQHFGGEASIARKLTFIDDHTTLALSYKLEAARVYGFKDYMPDMFKKEKGTDLVSEPSLTLSHITTDNRLDPRSGHEIVLSAGIVTRVLGSSHDYVKLDAKATQYFSFFDDIIRGHIGAKIGSRPPFGSHTDHVPLYDRYFLGGGDTLRGFPYRDVGPAARGGHNFGGQSMMLFTGEISHPIYDFIRGAVFVDAGGAWADAGGFSFGDGFNVGMGYGLRINIPQIDYPIKLDLAYPIHSTQPGMKKKLRFHFDVGFNW